MIHVSKKFSPVTLTLSDQDDVRLLLNVIRERLKRSTERFYGLGQRDVPTGQQDEYHKLLDLEKALEKTCWP